MIHDLGSLKKAVEHKIGRTITVTTDFEKLAYSFSKEQIKLSGKALKHVWCYIKGKEKPSKETLDKLALFAGFQNWKDFQKALHGETDAEINYEDVDDNQS